MNPSRFEQWASALQEPPERRKQIPKVRRGGASGTFGKRTGLPINRWFALVFEWNEFRSLKWHFDESMKPLTDSQILHNFKVEFLRENNRRTNRDQTPGGSVLSGKHSVNFHRIKFNKGILYKDQPRSIFVSWRYHHSSHIYVVNKRREDFPTFQDCQQTCIDYKIADPRFFSPEDMEKIDQYAKSKGILSDWSIPTLEELNAIHKYFPMTLYRSCKTYDLWKENKFGYKPKRKTQTVDSFNKKIEQEEKRRLQELENQRRETKAIIESIKEQEDHYFKTPGYDLDTSEIEGEIR